MSIRGFAAVAIGCAMLGSVAHAACASKATAGALPDGKSASAEEMAAATADMKKYMADMQDYLSCLEMTKPGGASWTDTYNKNAETMEGLAKKFNEQVKIFKARAN